MRPGFRQGHAVNRKRVQRLMQGMGLEVICSARAPASRTRASRLSVSVARPAHRPGPSGVGGRHHLYSRWPQGFLYLVAMMDWHSRYVLAWRLSNCSMRASASRPWRRRCARAARDLQHRPGQPVHRRRLHWRAARPGVAISMDGRGRFADNSAPRRRGKEAVMAA